MAAILRQWIDPWATMAWIQLWQVSLLAVAIGAIAPWLGRRWPHLAYVLWTLVIVKCLMPPVLCSPPGVFCWWPRFPGPSLALAPLPAGEPLAAPLFGEPSLPTLLADVSPTAPVWLAAPQGVWALALLVLWGAPMFGLLGCSLSRWRRAHSQLRATSRPAPRAVVNLEYATRQRMKMARPTRVWISMADYGPLVFGWRRPTVVLPGSLLKPESVNQLQPLLAHELAHVRRADTLLSVLQYVAHILWWFHPAVWWANRELNRYCELCCDEEAIASTGCSAKRYAASLLDVVELRRPWRPGICAPSIAGVHATHVTSRRLLWIMGPCRGIQQRTPAWCWGVAVAVALVVLPGASFHKPQLPPSTSVLRQTAKEALLRQDWPTAVTAYRAVLAVEPGDGLSWLQLGYCLHSAGDLTNAIGAHQKAAEHRQWKCVGLYNWACALALRGQTEQALSKLDEAISAGFHDAELLKADLDWSGLRSHPQFSALLRRLQMRHGFRKRLPLSPLAG